MPVKKLTITGTLLIKAFLVLSMQRLKDKGFEANVKGPLRNQLIAIHRYAVRETFCLGDGIFRIIRKQKQR